MTVLERIVKDAMKNNLCVERVNSNTLKIHDSKYAYESWIVIDTGTRLELHHQSDKNNRKKHSYHLQKTIKKGNWMWIVGRILNHKKFLLRDRWNARENKVDRILRKYEKNRRTIKN